MEVMQLWSMIGQLIRKRKHLRLNFLAYFLIFTALTEVQSTSTSTSTIRQKVFFKGPTDSDGISSCKTVKSEGTD